MYTLHIYCLLQCKLQLYLIFCECTLKTLLLSLCQLELAVWLYICLSFWLPNFLSKIPRMASVRCNLHDILGLRFWATSSPWWSGWGSVLIETMAVQQATLQVTSLRGALIPVENQVWNPRIAWPGCEWQWTARKQPRDTEMNGSSWPGPEQDRSLNISLKSLKMSSCPTMRSSSCYLNSGATEICQQFGERFQIIQWHYACC
jgi:hypothetical protein